MTTSHQPAPLVFGDTETTDVLNTRRLIEVALIRRDPDGDQRAGLWIVDDVDLSGATLEALTVNHFYERHPRYGGEEPKGHIVTSEQVMAGQMEEILRPEIVKGICGTGTPDDPLSLPPTRLVPVWLIGDNPGFDAHSVAELFGRHRLPYVVWHHPIDIVSMAVGFLAGRRPDRAEHNPQFLYEQLRDLQPPWRARAVHELLALPPIPDDDAHTALGDARRVMQIWDLIMGSNATTPLEV